MEITKYTRSRASTEARIRRQKEEMSKDAREKEPLIKYAVEALDDKSVSNVSLLLPVMEYSGNLIAAGTRIAHTGGIYRARTDLWDSPESSPENAPDLWERIMYRDGYRIIPAEITAENPFANGEIGWWGDILMESLYSTNVWTPEEAPEMWIVAEVST